ncbi:MAG: histidinol-phosphate transaminase [Clostridiaceae bacterium]|nr:histidinol-phosphate transaminase [Clostridiaceae bacterium]
MSKFLCERYSNLEPYVPGEQPKDRKYIKLNANETSIKPSPEVLKILKSKRMDKLGFYADPDAIELRQAIAEKFNLKVEQVFAGNGSDEVLGMIFLAFFDRKSKIAFPDITYGFYKTFSKSFGIDGKEIPLKSDFSVDVDAFIESKRHIILANPNAPTGFVLPLSEIERMVKSDRDRLVVIDEAYIDYDVNNESCIPLIKKYDNLIVVHTMSKSKNLAGVHIGYCIADEKLIEDLNGIKFAFNPFNLNDIAVAIGAAAIKDNKYYEKCIKQIVDNREYLKSELKVLGFKVLDSKTNFIFVTHPNISAKFYNQELRERGILARYYNSPRIDNYLRITIGTREEMEAVIQATKEIIMEYAA